jgi:hypothetical protein
VTGPGITKTRRQPLIETRHIDLFKSSDYRWRQLFEAADVVSEGATKEEPDGAVYYGSTSILLLSESEGGQIEEAQLAQVTRVISRDPHARTRAVRIACIEAQLRAGGPIGRVRAELFVRADRRGVRIDVEVESVVLKQLRKASGSAQTPSAAAPGRKRRARRTYDK